MALEGSAGYTAERSKAMKKPEVAPEVTEETLIEVANKIAARRGAEEGEKWLRFMRRGLEVAKRYPLTDEEAMELAVSELHAMRAERDERALTRC
jgi:hypothetical protein